jgi:hypothetical protein
MEKEKKGRERRRKEGKGEEVALLKKKIKERRRKEGKEEEQRAENHFFTTLLIQK